MEGEWPLREKPGPGFAPVATRATAAVISYGDGIVRWAVTFVRYVPRRPLEMRVKTNETTGQDMEIPPPPIIEERKLNGRLAVQGDDLLAAIRQGMQLCEEKVKLGRRQP